MSMSLMNRSLPGAGTAATSDHYVREKERKQKKLRSGKAYARDQMQHLQRRAGGRFS